MPFPGAGQVAQAAAGPGGFTAMRKTKIKPFVALVMFSMASPSSALVAAVLQATVSSPDVFKYLLSLPVRPCPGARRHVLRRNGGSMENTCISFP